MPKYTKELLAPVVAKSSSVAQVLKYFKLQYSGGNYSHMQKVIRKLELDTSHFTGQGHMKGKVAKNKRPLEVYLSNKHRIHSNTLKKRLIKEGYYEYRCQLCNLTEWLGEPISLELHHINCNHNDNSLSNLQLLCPNCHAHIHKT